MEMFRNRLVKVNRHLGRQARRQGISCYRLYDHDLPEFPIRIELYGEAVYVSEYKRQHRMTEEAHAQWLVSVRTALSEFLEIAPEHIHMKLRQRKAGRQGQYQKTGEARSFFEVEEIGRAHV